MVIGSPCSDTKANGNPTVSALEMHHQSAPRATRTAHGRAVLGGSSCDAEIASASDVVYMSQRAEGNRRVGRRVHAVYEQQIECTLETWQQTAIRVFRHLALATNNPVAVPFTRMIQIIDRAAAIGRSDAAVYPMRCRLSRRDYPSTSTTSKRLCLSASFQSLFLPPQQTQHNLIIYACVWR